MAQAISQLLQATQRSELTKMDFITLPGSLHCIQRPMSARKARGVTSCGNRGTETALSSGYQYFTRPFRVKDEAPFAAFLGRHNDRGARPVSLSSRHRMKGNN